MFNFRLFSKPVFGFVLLLLVMTVLSLSLQAATFTVTKTENTNDNLCNSDCSLREAIAAANSGASDDVIEFDPSVFNRAQIIRAGDLEINGNGALVINGRGAGLLTLDGSNANRLITAIDGANLTINGLTITRGNGRGSSAFLEGGGGIYNLNGILTINNSVISSNIASGGNSSSKGGGIYNGGILRVSGSAISGNSTYAGGGSSGGGIFNDSGSSLTVTGSTITNNTAGEMEGGGIFNRSGVTTVITNSLISNNNSWNGGGIYNTSGTLTISSSSFSNNTQLSNIGAGGGVHHKSGMMVIINSTFNNNSAAGGGGVVNDGTAEVTNSTFFGNVALNGSGGGISNGGAMTIVSSTISSNSAAATTNFDGGDGGGIINGGTVNARSSIFADNVSSNGRSPDFKGTLTSQGYNLIENFFGTVITGNTVGNILRQDPQLLALDNYGGTTKTVALQPTSPAIDAGDPNNFPANDQRGVVRPQDGDLNGSSLPDIGAYERQVTLLTVTKSLDTNDGTCDADCSLREAVAVTNTATNPDNKIEFASSVFNARQTITLFNGQLTISKTGTLVINGTAANLLTLSGNNKNRIFLINKEAAVVINGMTITEGREDFSSGGGIANGGLLTLTHSSVIRNSSSAGGGVSNGGVVNIINCVVSENFAETSGGGVSNNGITNKPGIVNIFNSNVGGNTAKSGGAGIYNSFSNITISNSIFSNNNVTGGSGGAIFNSTGALRIDTSAFDNNSSTQSGGGIRVGSGDNNTLIVTNSTFYNNKASFGGGIRVDAGASFIADTTFGGNTADFRGGGLLNNSGALTVTGSTFDGNSAKDDGGGIYNFGNFSATNSTVSNNTATDEGGGIASGNGNLNLTNVTVSHNAAAYGGGVFNTSALNARSTIIARNTGSGGAPDFYGTLNSQGYNLIENLNTTTITGTVTGNILGKDPLLGSLTNNGGPTTTRSLLPGSPAIDAGDPGNFPPNDQRGFTRPRDGDGNGIIRVDIGAFEVRPVLVTNINDNGAGSLRQALTDVRALGDTVVFNTGALSTAQTITLTGGELVVSNGVGLTIIGSTTNRLTISGNNQSRVFNIRAGANVVISSVNITAGKVITVNGNSEGGGGGGIYNNGTLTLIDSIVSGSSAEGGGGGINNNSNGIYSGSLFLINTTVKENSTKYNGGGIFNSLGSLITLSNSTVSNNSSDSFGGGIYNLGEANIVTSTISGNNASPGGGISNSSGELTLTNSTVSGNSSKGSGGGIYNDIDTVLNINNSTITKNFASQIGGGVDNQGSGIKINALNTIIAGNSSGWGSADFDGTLVSRGYNLIQDTDHTTITGVTTGNVLNVNPLLDPILRNNGGATLTHALRLDSPAIDKGSAAAGITTDQRGFARPVDFPSVPNAAGGNGSDIGAFERQSTDVNRNTFFDYDGDGKSDISLFRPSDRVWYLQNSNTGAVSFTQFGLSTDKIVPADYDGDGKTDIAVFRPENGIWFILKSSGGVQYTQFGTAEDFPVPADYNGDGKAEIAVFRPSLGVWFIFNDQTSQYTVVQFGSSEDKPAAADYNGDGKAEIAVYRPSSGLWFVYNAATGQYATTRFGISTDKPVPADYDGDGRTDIAVFRPSEGNWYILGTATTGGYTVEHFGLSTDLPTPADFDGDGKTDIAVYRPSEGNWYQLKSRDRFGIIRFGISEDKPTPNAFVR